MTDLWGEEHLPIRVITHCKSLFGCLAKGASVPEDRGTALTVASLREMCSARVGRDTTRSGLMWVPTRVQLADGLTKSSARVLRNALISGNAQLHEESNNILRRKQLSGSSKEVRDDSVAHVDLEQKDWWTRRYNPWESCPRSTTECLSQSILLSTFLGVFSANV